MSPVCTQHFCSGVLPVVLQAGGDNLQIQGLRTSLSWDAQRIGKMEARRLAVAEALSIARELAEAAGVELGPLLTVTDGGASQPTPMPRFTEAGAPQPMAMAAGGPAATPMPVTLADAAVHANVSIVHAIL